MPTTIKSLLAKNSFIGVASFGGDLRSKSCHSERSHFLESGSKLEVVLEYNTAGMVGNQYCALISVIVAMHSAPEAVSEVKT
jgi:hypothetical protein